MADRWIDKFRKDAFPSLVKKFKPEKVIIFGSRVRGVAKKDSDIDIIVISNYFEKIPFLKRMPLILKKVPFQKHVDYICYTPDEYKKIKDASSLISGALEDSIELAI
ncbi:MAG: nucleotidyltransferase domain-containing protein [Candidatus Schekmanbacteria bacterium]|nr:nucleotidyltransferase domain-containing protein [Candidatus Schekmanbacteria bacterium]